MLLCSSPALSHRPWLSLSGPVFAGYRSFFPFGPILNLLSAVTSTASGSRICEFLAHSVQSVLSALTQFAASFCRNSAPTVLGFGKLHMVRAAYSTCSLPLWVLSTCIVIPSISCTFLCSWWKSQLSSWTPVPLVTVVTCPCAEIRATVSFYVLLSVFGS